MANGNGSRRNGVALAVMSANGVANGSINNSISKYVNISGMAIKRKQ
jgi:hypothetical protein